MNQIQILARFAESFMNPPKWEAILKQSAKAMDMLLAGNGAGSEYLGWVNLPSSITNEELVRIEKTAERIRNPNTWSLSESADPTWVQEL